MLIPFPHAVDDHQTSNAGFLVEVGAAILLPQSELTADTLGNLLRELLSNPQRLLEMAQASRRLARPQAAETVGRACLEEMRNV